MIATIQGIEVVDYTSAKTNKHVEGLQVYFTFNNSKVYGQATGNVYVSGNASICSELRSYGNPLDLRGRQLTVEYDNRGYMVECALLPVAPVPPDNKNNR